VESFSWCFGYFRILGIFKNNLYNNEFVFVLVAEEAFCLVDQFEELVSNMELEREI